MTRNASPAGVEINRSALEPLFLPWEFPNAHRRRAEKEGQRPKIVQRRRPSPIAIANNLRAAVRDFRDSQYSGASDTTRELLYYWFATDHSVKTKDGTAVPFPARPSHPTGQKARSQIVPQASAGNRNDHMAIQRPAPLHP